MGSKQNNWVADSISNAVAFYVDFAGVSTGEIERAIGGEEFSGAEVLASFAGKVAHEEVTGATGGSNDWSDWAELAA